MKWTSNIRADARRDRVNVILMVLLPLLAVLAGVVVGWSGQKIGAGLLAGIAGAGCVLFAIAVPKFGYYFSIFLSFFFADIGRFFKTDLPLGTAIDIFVFLTFLGILLRKLTRGEAFWMHCKNPIMYAYGGIILYSLVEIFNPNAVSRDVSLLILRRFFAIQVFLYCSLQLFTDMKAIKQFFRVWTVLALIGGLYACYQQWAHYPKYELDYILSDTHLTDLYSLDNGDFRKFSFLADPTSFGILMAACALVNMVFILMLKNLDQTRKLFLLFCTGVLMLAMSYSGTRTAYGAFAAGVALYVLLNLSDTRTMVFACFSFAIFVMLIFGPFHGNATLNRIRTTFHPSKDASLQVRDINRKRIQPYLHAHPLGGGLGSTGLGTTAGSGAEKSHMTNHPLAGFPTDSGFLRMALEYGWIGLIIQIITFFVILREGIKAYFSSRIPLNRTILLASVICLFSYILAHYAQVAIGPLPGAFLFYPLIAVIIRLRQLEFPAVKEVKLKT